MLGTAPAQLIFLLGFCDPISGTDFPRCLGKPPLEGSAWPARLTTGPARRGLPSRPGTGSVPG